MQLQMPTNLKIIGFLTFHVLISTQPVVSRTSLEWAEDLFLMNHWTASTYRTILHRDAAVETLQTRMPEMAMSYPFAMHVILTLAAFTCFVFVPRMPINGQHFRQSIKTAVSHSLKLFYPA